MRVHSPVGHVAAAPGDPERVGVLRLPGTWKRARAPGQRRGRVPQVEHTDPGIAGVSRIRIHRRVPLSPRFGGPVRRPRTPSDHVHDAPSPHGRARGVVGRAGSGAQGKGQAPVDGPVPLRVRMAQVAIRQAGVGGTHRRDVADDARTGTPLSGRPLCPHLPGRTGHRDLHVQSSRLPRDGHQCAHAPEVADRPVFARQLAGKQSVGACRRSDTDAHDVPEAIPRPRCSGGVVRLGLERNDREGHRVSEHAVRRPGSFHEIRVAARFAQRGDDPPYRLHRGGNSPTRGGSKKSRPCREERPPAGFAFPAKSRSGWPRRVRGGRRS